MFGGVAPVLHHHAHENHPAPQGHDGKSFWDAVHKEKDHNEKGHASGKGWKGFVNRLHRLNPAGDAPHQDEREGHPPSEHSQNHRLHDNHLVHGHPLPDEEHDWHHHPLNEDPEHHVVHGHLPEAWKHHHHHEKDFQDEEGAEIAEMDHHHWLHYDPHDPGQSYHDFHDHKGFSHDPEMMHHPAAHNFARHNEKLHPTAGGALTAGPPPVSWMDDDMSSTLLMLTGLVALSLLVCGQLRRSRANRSRCTSVTVPMVSLIMGCLYGIGMLIVEGRAAGNHLILKKIIKFNKHIFFTFLLPPIIFANGFTKIRGHVAHFFFHRFGTILWFSAFTTILNFTITTALLYALRFTHIVRGISFRTSLILSAALAPTDPICVLSLLKDLKVSPITHTVIIGEALLNDAFAIFLYNSLLKADPSHLLLDLFVISLSSFTISMLLGLGLGLGVALIMKISWRFPAKEANEPSKHPNTHKSLETGLYIAAPWAFYFLSERLGLSGVVCVSFAGIAMARYAVPNFSPTGQQAATHFYKAVSTICETSVFVVLGMSTVCLPELMSHMADFGNHYVTGIFGWVNKITESIVLFRVLCLFSFVIVIMLVARIAAVCTTTFIVNTLISGSSAKSLNSSFVWTLALCGLKGAIAVALTIEAGLAMSVKEGAAVVATSIVYTSFTVLCLSPLLPYILGRTSERKVSGEEGGRAVAKPPPLHFGHPAREPRRILMWKFVMGSILRLDMLITQLVAWSDEKHTVSDLSQSVLPDDYEIQSSDEESTRPVSPVQTPFGAELTAGAESRSEWWTAAKPSV